MLYFHQECPYGSSCRFNPVFQYRDCQPDTVCNKGRHDECENDFRCEKISGKEHYFCGPIICR